MKITNGLTNLNFQVHSGDSLDQVSPCRCSDLKAKDADLLVIQRFGQADQTRLPLHQEGPSLVAVDCLPSDRREQPGLSGAHVHRAQGRPDRCVLWDGEGVLRLAEGGDERVRRDHVDESRHQGVFGWGAAVGGFDEEREHGPLEVVHVAFGHHPATVWLHLSSDIKNNSLNYMSHYFTAI